MNNKHAALVTGGNRGIGAAIVDQLVQDGFRVVATATSETGAAAIAARLGDPSSGLVMRLEDPATVSQAIEQAIQTLGVVSVLVNNAGLTRDNLLLRMSDVDWNLVLDVNFRSLHTLCKPVLRGMMKQRWGRIINIGSVVGRMGNAGQANYSAAKAAIEGFTRALSQEVGSRGITVNCVAPGMIATDMTKDLGTRVDQLVSRIPLGRIGTPQEVANAVSFLASERANYISGQTLHVNGGLYMA